MKTSRSLLLASLVAAGAFTAAAEDADARVRRGQATIETPRGVFQGQGSVQRQRGERTREGVVTGPNGGQSTVTDHRTWNRQEGVASHDRERVFPNGDTRTVESDAWRTAPGEWSAQRTVTGVDGDVRTQTGDFSTARTENGRTTTGDIQTSNLGQIDYSREVAREDGVRSVNSSATFEDGTSIARSSTGSCDGQGACQRSTDFTNRAGETTQIDESRVRDGAIVNYDRDTTFADGTTRSVDRERVGNGDGTGVVTRTVTGRDGETRTQTGAYAVESTPQ